jgi:hypothetical protein
MVKGSSRFARPAGICMLTAVLVGCGGCISDQQFGKHRGAGPDTVNIVQRPTYAIPETKPLFLGGYAGANYGPSRIRSLRPFGLSRPPVIQTYTDP